jgi:hypothetical protein
MVGLVALGGCAFKGGDDGASSDAGRSRPSATQPADPDPTAADEPAPWWPRPVRINVYPATQFVQRDGEPMLKASIELLDQLGDSIKAPGHLRLELLARGRYGRVGKQLYRWDVSLRTLEHQQQYFDLVTRTYVLRLSLDSSKPTDKPTLLRVTFTQPEGPRLQTERALPIEW